MGLGSLAITQEEQDTPKFPRQRYSKKRIIPSSPPSVELPETQQEVLNSSGSIALEVPRLVDCHSQGYSTLASSQVASAAATQDTGVSKDTTEGDSTLGSSLPPDSPAVSPLLIQGPSSQVLSSNHSRSLQASVASVPAHQNSPSTGAAFLTLKREPQSNPLDLLVARSDPIGETDTARSCLVEESAEHTNNSLPSSPLFVTDQDNLDLQPIAGPDRLGEEREAEGKLGILSASSSPTSFGNHNAIQLGATQIHHRPAIASARSEQSQSRSRFSAGTADHSHPRPEQDKAPESLNTTTKSIRGTPIRSIDERSVRRTRSSSSGHFHSQLSLVDAPATKTQSLPRTSRRNTPDKSTVTIRRHSRAPAALWSLESGLRPTFSAHETPSAVAPLLHSPSSPHHSVSSGASTPASNGFNMPTSHRESSPRVRRPPSAPSEMTPELGLRDKLRQIRATSHANQDARARSQAKTGSSNPSTTTTLETRPLRRVSPEKKYLPLATISTAAEDQPIPPLENSDGNAGEMELDKVHAEPALTSSLGTQPPTLDAALGKSIIPMPDQETEKTAPELDIPTMPLLQPSEFVVPLPVDARIKHQYVAELAGKYKEINDFLESPGSPRLMNAMTDMIRRLNDTVVHTDLGLNGPATQIASTTEEVLWAEDASSKFAFLGHIIDILRGSTHHIVLVARSGTTLDLLHSFLKGKHVTCQQHSGADPAGDMHEGGLGDPMRYTSLCTDRVSLQNIPHSASLIIAFDDSFDTALLPASCSTSRFVPILLLLVVNSAEHVGRCIPQDTPGTERLRRLIKAVVHVHQKLGEMPFHIDFRYAFNLDEGARLALVKKDHGAKIAHAAGKTAEALQSKSFALNFTLRSISELDLAGLEDHPSSVEDSKEVSSSASRAGTPGGQKRLHVSKASSREGSSDIVQNEGSSSAAQAKRQRLTALRDMTHISDSMKNSQSHIDELKIALKKAHLEATEERKARLKAEESATYSQNRLTEISQSLGEVQHRYETRTKQVHELKNEKQRFLSEREIDNRRRERLLAENIALKDQRVQYQEELRAVRDVLKTSTIPGLAELEQARDEARRATDEALRLQSSADNSRRDFEFTLSQYQDASIKAVELVSQISDLEAANAELTRQASDERRRLAELNYKEDRKRDLARIAELEAEKRNLEGVLRRVEEENKALGKGRGVATRGSSVQPGGGSPRPGGGSRAGSPALGTTGLLGGGGSNAHVHAHVPVGGRARALRNER